jgi:two-component system, OmpR family, sensor kinase
LRWRLTAWVATAMLLSTAVIFVVVYRDVDHDLRSQIDHDIAGDAVELALPLDALSHPNTRVILAAAQRGIDTEPYRTTDLLLVVVPGAGATSNDPGLFGDGRLLVGARGTTTPAPSVLGRALLVSHDGFSSQAAPGGITMRVFERTVTVGKHTVVVGAGESLAVVTDAERSLVTAFIFAGGLAFAIALLAAYFAGARVSAPLRHMAAVSATVDAGDLKARMTAPVGHNDEVRILADAFNHMLDRLAEHIDSQRSFVADASHELRTPLTVIRGQLEVLAAQPNPSGAEVRSVERLVSAEITRTSRLVDDLLLLAQAERPAFLHVEAIDAQPYVAELWDGMSLTAKRSFELGPVPAGTLRADPDRLAQALRNLARNAIEHTRDGDGLIRLDVTHLPPDHLCFTISDNGEGIPPDELTRVFERFHRTDPARSRATGGVGLGLAIVRAIAEAHDGHVVAGNVPDGDGARIDLEIPRFTATPRALTLRSPRENASPL